MLYYLPNYLRRSAIVLCIGFLLAGLNAAAQQQPVVAKYLYGGPDSDVGYSIKPAADGGYIVMSMARSSVFPPDPRGPGKGMYDIWVTKLNSSFGIQWHRFYGGANDEFPSISSGIHETRYGSGDFVFAAMTSSSAEGVMTS